MRVVSQVAVVGGYGQIARLLHPLLLRDGRTPVPLVRSPEQATALEEAGCLPRLLDLEHDGADAWREALAGCDAVVFAAGGGPDGDAGRKRTVDLAGSLAAQQAAQQQGIDRFVQVSAIGVDADPGPESGDVWRAYVRAKREADQALRATSLAWTVLRPGRLTDTAGTGLVSLGPDVPRGEVPRADVAAVLAACVGDPRTVGQQWNLVGGEVPVAEALARATG